MGQCLRKWCWPGDEHESKTDDAVGVVVMEVGQGIRDVCQVTLLRRRRRVSSVHSRPTSDYWKRLRKVENSKVH